MKLEELNLEYDKLQKKYGAKELDSIYYGGCPCDPDICFVFMNPTGKNIASSKEWKGMKSPWLGTKNIWDLFHALGLMTEEIYQQIKRIKSSEWTEEFCESVYHDVEKHRYFITNLGKCTQIDARPLPNTVYKEYLELLKQEIEWVNPKVIVLFGNQVSSIVLDEKIAVSQCRRKKYVKKIGKKEYPIYSVYYPVGNGRFNIEKSIADIKWIMEKEC